MYSYLDMFRVHAPDDGRMYPKHVEIWIHQ